MWCLTKDGKEWTCPKNNLYALALMHQMDRGITHGNIHDDLSAKEVLEKHGFIITEIEEPEELTEIPKVADWYNWQHRELYNKINEKSYNGVPLTEAEREFSIDMYHAEEAAHGML